MRRSKLSHTIKVRCSEREFIEAEVVAEDESETLSSFGRHSINARIRAKRTNNPPLAAKIRHALHIAGLH